VKIKHPLTPYYNSASKNQPAQWLPVHPKSAATAWKNYLGWVFDINSSAKNVAFYRRRENSLVKIRASGYDLTSAKVNGFVDQEIPVHAFKSAADCRSFDKEVQNLVQTADVAASRLRSAVKGCNPKGEYQTLNAADAAFWERTREPFFKNLDTLRDIVSSGQPVNVKDDYGEKWANLLIRLVFDLFDTYAPFDCMNPSLKGDVVDIAAQHRFMSAFFFGKSGSNWRSTLGI